MKKFFKLVFVLLAVLSYVLLLFMAWPLSGFDLTMKPYVNNWHYLGIAAAVILGLFVLMQLISFARKNGQKELTEQRDGGTVRIVSGAVAGVAVNAAKQHQQVKMASAEVKQAGKDAAIDLKMKVDVLASALQGQSIKSLAEDIKRSVSQKVEAFSGYPIHNFDIQIDVEESAESADESAVKRDVPETPVVLAEPSQPTEGKVAKTESAGDRLIKTESTGLKTYVEAGERPIELPEKSLSAELGDDDRERDFVLKK